MEKFLKQEIVDTIKNDAILFGKVADALLIKPVTLPRLLVLNHAKLKHPVVLRLLRKYLGLQDSDLLIEIQPESKNPIAA